MASEQESFRTILGVRFYMSGVRAAVDRMLRDRGLLLVPAAPALRTITTDGEYRRALLTADLIIADSAYMVLIWKMLEGESIPRVSGLGYLRELLSRPELKSPSDVFWIMASPKSAELNLTWLRENGMTVPEASIYMAPMYGGGELHDDALLRRLEELRPAHIVVTLGGGTQERLGLFLRERLSYRPGIHCIGAAIAFLSGDQVAIPPWADKMYLGWLFRIVSEPKRYGPRYWNAVGLFLIMWRYREKLPPLESVAHR